MVANAPTYAGELVEWFGLTIDVGRLGRRRSPHSDHSRYREPPLVEARTKELIRRLPSARSKIMEGTGHVPHRPHPRMWLDTLVEHYEELARPDLGS